ncbi:MAG: hypothetical protein KBA30_04270 [Clostridia bacterium]|nr:hypothetical protein [Clostridia bacterium]
MTVSRLRTYADFLDRADELGFLFLSRGVAGAPGISDEVPGNQWHTGDPESDPWLWKDRAAAEKRLAFGCLLGGRKGFIAPRMYPVFYAACLPERTLAERRTDGLVGPAKWKLWQLFEEKGKRNLGTWEIRQALRGTDTLSAIDRAVTELSQEFYLTVSGNKCRTDRFGQPYGWPSNMYDTVAAWVPPEWGVPDPDWDREGARGAILAEAAEHTPGVDRALLRRILFGRGV